ncbi:Uncharacterized protein TCAP_00492 [Tolypocladium capitatum]|uniref:Tat pathway signal sequence n=1 Tax=Tolypocladium capitatum TaxID=45235 RepID=A0A2K3QPY9_9HYPO|nr:Uncharacterized protein TCAP_00492 [Tolypocladium capitatum]
MYGLDRRSGGAGSHLIVRFVIPLLPALDSLQTSSTKTMAKEAHSHRLLADGPDDSEDDSGFPQNASNGVRQRNSGAARWLAKSLVLLFILAAVCIASFWAGTYVTMRQSALDGTCAAHTTQWSPLLKDVSIRYRFHDFNGSFMDEDIYRRPGSPEVDEAWEALGVDYRAGVISHQDGLASGLGQSFVQRSDKYGGGFLECIICIAWRVFPGSHRHAGGQLTILQNLLRKALYFNYDRYKELGEHAFKNEERILRRHVTHCLDTIRQVLMCNVDTGVLGQVWVDAEQPTAFPDFNTRHVCKNYADVREWAGKLQVRTTRRSAAALARLLMSSCV